MPFLARFFHITFFLISSWINHAQDIPSSQLIISQRISKGSLEQNTHFFLILPFNVPYLLCGRHHLQCSLLIPGGRRCPCSWPNFVPLEESSDSAWWSLRTREERESRPKGKGGHPWGVEVFTTPPFVLYFHFPWLIAGESESRVCLFCNLLRVFVNIFVSH